MKIGIKKAGAYLASLILVLLIACSNDDSGGADEPSQPEKELSRANFTIEELLNGFSDIVINADSVTISGIVIGNDKGGNIINTLYLEDDTEALQLNIEGDNLFQTFREGQKLIINCKGMLVDSENKELIPQNTLSISSYDTAINITGESEEIQAVSLIYREIGLEYLNNLVKVRNFQFEEPLVGNPIQPGDQEFLQLKDNNDSIIQIYLRSDADFANENIPTQRGPITGILEKDGENYYLVPRDFEDFEFSFDRRAPFVKRTFDFNGNVLPYQVMFPFEYDENDSYPIVIFLHGAGERGTNNTSQMAFGPNTFGSYEARQDYPAIVIFPQCPSDVMWSRRIKYTDENDELIFEFPVEAEPNYAMEMVIELVKFYMDNEAVDPNRIYVTGLSMGGIGSFEFAYYAPELPAAVASMAGGHDAELLTTYGQDIAFSLYHGSNDGVVPARYSREMYAKMQELGYNSQYSEADGRGHEWNYVLNDETYIEWLFQQSK